MVIPTGSLVKCRQPLPSGLLHDNVRYFIYRVSASFPVVLWLTDVATLDWSNRYSDLECDYINPIDLCNRLNTYIVPEAAVHAFLTALFLINGYWLALLLNLPLVVFNVKKLATRLPSPMT